MLIWFLVSLSFNMAIFIVGKRNHVDMLLQLSLCAVTIIQLTSSQSTYDVTRQQKGVTGCGTGSSGQSEQVLRQLATAMSQLQRDVAEMKAVISPPAVKGKF